MTSYKKLQFAQLMLTAVTTAAIPPTFTLAGAMAFLLSPIVLITAALALAVGAYLYFTSGAEEAAASTDAVATATADAVKPTTAWGASLESIKKAMFTDEVVKKLSDVKSETSELMTQYSELKNSLSQPFIDGQAALTGYLASFLPIKEGSSFLVESLKAANDGMKKFRDWTDTAKTSLMALGVVMVQGGDTAAGVEYVKQGMAISRMAEESAKLTEKLTAQRTVFKSLGEMQRSATASAAASAEVAKVATLMSVEAIDAKVDALRREATAAITNGKSTDTKGELSSLSEQRKALDDKSLALKQEATTTDSAKKKTEEWKTEQNATTASIEKQRKAIDDKIAAMKTEATTVGSAVRGSDEWKAATKTMLDALAKQRQGIIDGTIVDKAAEEAKKALAKSQDDAAKAARTAAEQQNQLDRSAESQIQSLQDQYDLLTGAATKADIAMRSAKLAGFNKDQIELIGEMTAEVERLNEEAKPKKADKADKTKKDGTLKAALAGSAESASIILRGVGGQGSKQETLLAQGNKIAAENLAVNKANKTQALQVANIV